MLTHTCTHLSSVVWFFLFIHSFLFFGCLGRNTAHTKHKSSTWQTQYVQHFVCISHIRRFHFCFLVFIAFCSFTLIKFFRNNHKSNQSILCMACFMYEFTIPTLEMQSAIDFLLLRSIHMCVCVWVCE